MTNLPDYERNLTRTLRRLIIVLAPIDDWYGINNGPFNRERHILNTANDLAIEISRILGPGQRVEKILFERVGG